MSKTHKEMIAEIYADCSEEDLAQIIPNENKPAMEYEPRNKEERGDGGATHYYELPAGATELKHLIKHKKMEHGIGESFCALYRLNDNGEYERNLRKAKYYIDSELEYIERNK